MNKVDAVTGNSGCGTNNTLLILYRGSVRREHDILKRRFTDDDEAFSFL